MAEAESCNEGQSKDKLDYLMELLEHQTEHYQKVQRLIAQVESNNKELVKQKEICDCLVKQMQSGDKAHASPGDLKNELAVQIAKLKEIQDSNRACKEEFRMLKLEKEGFDRKNHVELEKARNVYGKLCK